MARQVLLFVVFASACYRPHPARVRFERDFECTNNILIKNLGANTFRVRGCGRTVTYVCQNRVCVIESDDGGVLVNHYKDGTTSGGPQGQDHVQDGVTNSKSSSGTRIITAQFGNQRFAMHLQSSPLKENRKVWLGVRIWSLTPVRASCPLKLMINGELLALDPPRYQHRRGYEELHVQLAYEDLYSLAEGPRVVGRVCDDEFRLSEDNILILRELVSRIYEELAWANMLTPEDRARRDKGKAEATPAPGESREL